MKSFSAVLLFSLFLSLFAEAQNNTKIKGTFNGPVPQTYITLENYVQPTLFSKNIEIKNNKFSIDFPVQREDIYKLRLTDNNFLALVIKPGDDITLTLDSSNLALNPGIKGSEQTQRLYSTEAAWAGYLKTQDSIKAAFSASAGNEQHQKELEAQYFQIEMIRNNFLVNTVGEHIGDLVNVFFLNRLKIDDYPNINIAMDSALYSRFNYNPAIVDLHNAVEKYKVTAIGKVAPEIRLPSPEGDTLSLHSIQGKIIIIDFWASWCRPCRAENPNMTSLYADFHDKGLEILGVSLDKEKASWVKAIADDKLVWHHVSDLKFWNCIAAKDYGVGSIPSMFVLNSEHKIIAKNLRGEQLRAFVASKLN